MSQISPEVVTLADRILAAVEADQDTSEAFRPKLGASLTALSEELLKQQQANAMPVMPSKKVSGDGETVYAWRIEVAHNMVDGEYTDWRTLVTEHEPDPSAPNIRNIQELVAKK